MKNNIAGHEYQGLHGCRYVNESVKIYLCSNSNYQIDTTDKCECCVSVCSSVCPSVCHTFVSVTCSQMFGSIKRLIQVKCAPM